MTVPPSCGGRIVFLAYPGITALDLVGPHEILSRFDWPCLVAAATDALVPTANGLVIRPDVTFDACPQATVFVVPGGPGQVSAVADQALLAFVRRQAAECRALASVCTGALVLAAAGLLDGRPAATHWLARDELRRLGAVPVDERVVVDGWVYSGAGVSAGIDLALVLAADIFGRLAAETVQLGVEYDPRPPFTAGHPRTAPPQAVARLRAASRFGR